MYSVQGVFTLEPVYLITDREYSCAIIIYFELPRDGTIILFLRKKCTCHVFAFSTCCHIFRNAELSEIESLQFVIFKVLLQCVFPILYVAMCFLSLETKPLAFLSVPSIFGTDIYLLT